MSLDRMKELAKPQYQTRQQCQDIFNVFNGLLHAIRQAGVRSTWRMNGIIHFYKAGALLDRRGRSESVDVPPRIQHLIRAVYLLLPDWLAADEVHSSLPLGKEIEHDHH